MTPPPIPSPPTLQPTQRRHPLHSRLLEDRTKTYLVYRSFVDPLRELVAEHLLQLLVHEQVVKGLALLRVHMMATHYLRASVSLALSRSFSAWISLFSAANTYSFLSCGRVQRIRQSVCSAKKGVKKHEIRSTRSSIIGIVRSPNGGTPTG